MIRREGVSDEEWNSFVSGHDQNPVLGMTEHGHPVVDHFDPDFGPMREGERGSRYRDYQPHAVQNSRLDRPVTYYPQGRCVTCGRSTWLAEDGSEVPGHWASTANTHFAEDYGMHGDPIPQCAECANEQIHNETAVRMGEKPGGRWHHPGARINTCDKCYQDALDED